VAKDISEVLQIPSCALAPESDASFVVAGTDEIDGEVSDDSHVSCSMSLAQAGLIVGEGDVEHPVKAVLDGPVAAHGLGGA
jgi:hypothetical protein